MRLLGTMIKIEPKDLNDRNLGVHELPVDKIRSAIGELAKEGHKPYKILIPKMTKLFGIDVGYYKGKAE